MQVLTYHVLVDIVRKELPSVARFPSHLSVDTVHHDHEQAATYWHTCVQHRRKALCCEQAVRFMMILRSKLHNYLGCVGECVHRRGHHRILIGAARSGHGGKVNARLPCSFIPANTTISPDRESRRVKVRDGTTPV